MAARGALTCAMMQHMEVTYMYCNGLWIMEEYSGGVLSHLPRILARGQHVVVTYTY